MRGHTNAVTSIAFVTDGEMLASASDDGAVKLWDVRTGDKPEQERRFREWAISPDLHLHRELAEIAEKQKEPFALAFRLGRYLAARQHYAAAGKDRGPFDAPTFPDGIACTGVLYKGSGIDPKRLLIGTERALRGDPASWQNHALHGGALYRNGNLAEAHGALQKAIALHGKAHPLTHNLLALTHLALGETEKAKAALAAARPAQDAPWEDALVHRLFAPEITAAVAAAEGNRPKD